MTEAGAGGTRPRYALDKPLGPSPGAGLSWAIR